MSDKTPGKPNGNKPAKTLDPASSVTRPGVCWYGDPEHQPMLGWCPRSCTGAVIYSERTGNGDQHVYCDAHGNWRRKTIRLPLVRRMQPGEQPSPPPTTPNGTPTLTST